ncbi:MAG: protoporphyrinogen/coproporphyrinogen oxidase [Longimicrobiales bacterium]
MSPLDLVRDRAVARTRIVIVGAGVGGLALSRAFARRGVPHVVLEREAEPGGVIHTIRTDGRVLEAGPQRLRLTRSLHQLVQALGLEDPLVVAPRGLPLFIYRRGALRLAPLSLLELRRTDLFSWADKLRIFAEPLTRPARDHETVANYFIRRFGRAAYQDLLGPLFGGLYASDPADMLVRHALLPTLRELGGTRSTVLALLRREINSGASVRARHGDRDGGDRVGGAPACSFRSGLRTLTDAMSHSVREHVRLRSAALAIEHFRSPTAEEESRNVDDIPSPRAGGEAEVALTPTERAGAYRVVTDDGDLTASDVVLTCPASDAASLLRPLAPRAAAALDALHYNRIAIVYLIAEGVRTGMGYQVSFAEPLHTRGVTFNHSLFARDGVYTAFLGGARDPDPDRLSDDAIAATAAREFEQVTGRTGRPIHVTHARIPAWDRSWTALDDVRLPPGIHLCANYESRIGVLGRIARAEQLAAAIQ